MSKISSKLIGIINYNRINKLKFLKPICSNLCATNQISQIRLYNNVLGSYIPMLSVQECRIIALRHKSKQKGKTRGRDEDSDEEEDEEDNDFKAMGPGCEVKTLSLNSLRIDSLLREGLGYKRSTIEQWFYRNELRLNGRIISKKSSSFNVGDEVDVIKGFSRENPNFINVSRVEVVNIKPDVELSKFIVKANCSKNLLIENYEDHPYKHHSTD